MRRCRCRQAGDGQQATSGRPDTGQACRGDEVAAARQEDATGHDPPVGSGLASHRAHGLAHRVVGGPLEVARNEVGPGQQDRRQAGRSNRPLMDGPAGARGPGCWNRQSARLPGGRCSSRATRLGRRSGFGASGGEDTSVTPCALSALSRRAPPAGPRRTGPLGCAARTAAAPGRWRTRRAATPPRRPGCRR